MKRLLILTLFLVIVLSTPIQAEAQSETVFVYATSYHLDNGVTISGSLSDLRTENEIGMILREEKVNYTGEQIATAFETENDASAWFAEGNMGAPSASTDAPFSGTYSIESEASATGYGTVNFDNATTKTWGFDATYADSMNFTLKAEVANRFVLNEIRTYYTETQYAYIQPSITLSTVTWQTYSINAADMTLEGVQIGDPVNWVEFNFTIQAGGADKSIFFDDGGFYGSAPDDIVRQGDGYIRIANIPQDYDNYVLNISATHYTNTSYGDEFFTEDYNDWSSSEMILSDDSDNAIHGTNSLKAIFDPTQGNATVTFDNQSGNDMQADFSAYDTMEYHLWGNTSFVVDFAHMHTDADNYFFVDVDITYDSDSSTVTIPLGLYSEYGNPTMSNISYFEVSFTNTSNTDPFQLYFDGFYLQDSDKVIFTTDCNGVETFRSTHSHYGEGEDHTHWASTEITLNYTKIVESDYIVTVLINDTKVGGDAFNTSIEIDYIFITAWMDETTTITTTNIFTEIFLSTEMWGYLAPMALVIIGAVLAKYNRFLAVLWFLMTCLFVAQYFALVEAGNLSFWWHILILLFGGFFGCLLPALTQKR